MRQETNNEIDLLLRRLSRRQDVPVSSADSDHLDADELSAFAENALPAAARARYTEHLADCSKCREIVVELSASVPVVAVRETAAAPSALGKFLASFFSPMVLRYAVPALGLIIVAAIGFFALRFNQSPVNVAQSGHQAQSPPAPTSNTQEPASGFYDFNEAQRKSASPQASRKSDTEKPIAAAEEPPPPSAPPSGDISSPKTVAPAQTPAEPAAANAAAARAESVPTPSPTVDEMRVDVHGRRNDQSGGGQARELAKQKTAEVVQDQEKKTGEFQSAREAPRPAARAQGTGTASVGRLADKAEKDRDDGVIRSVAGKRFRKQSGFWVDTAYSSGSAIVNVGRSSEQYRALVADEPEIKKFAGELDGPFIVVWKGRTYRIR